tara:strand:- start:2204 stop:4150 length:1947 start_codon:yes stop_codon:yes gene_type:complete
MPTLANINGASLVSDFATPLAEGIGGIQDRRRKKAEESDLEALIRGSLGLAPQQQEQLPQGNGLFGKIEQRRDNGVAPQTGQQQSKGILGQLAPGLAKAISGARGNAEQEGQIRQEAESGQTLAAELSALPSHAARVKRLAQKGGEIASGGGDVGRVTSLANLPPEKLDLELMRMQMIGKEAIAQLPQQSRQDQIAALMARNPQLGSGMLARRDREIAEERARRERAAAAAAAARNRAARAAAAARAPKGAFAKGLAEIASNEAQGHISPEQAASRRSVLEGKLLSPSLEGAQDAANLNKTELGNQMLQQELDAASGTPAFDPESPLGKLVADRAGISETFGPDSPQVAEFDRLKQENTTAATSTEMKTRADIESVRLDNIAAAEELADPNSNLSAVEQEIMRTMDNQGVDRPTAQGIADGVLVTKTNPVTGDTEIVNVATSEIYKPTEIGGELPPLLPDAITSRPETDVGSPSRAFGSQGFGINALNTVVGAITGGRVDSATDEAVQTLNNLNTRTMLALSGEFPGKPSNLTREEIKSLSPVPASIFMGKDRARTKLGQMEGMLADAILGAHRVSTGDGDFAPADRAQAAKSVTQLLPIWEDYTRIIEQLDGGKGSGVANIVNQAEFDKLPKGTKFKLPDGTTGTKK